MEDVWEAVEVREAKVIRQGFAQYDPDGKLHWPVRKVFRETDGRRRTSYFGEGYDRDSAEYMARLLNTFPPNTPAINEAPETFVLAVQQLCQWLTNNGFGLTSDMALPGEFDTICLMLTELGRPVRRSRMTATEAAEAAINAGKSDDAVA